MREKSRFREIEMQKGLTKGGINIKFTITILNAMKSFRHLIAILLGLLGTSLPLGAQIRDNDASVATLAVHCAVSSGFSANDYEDYCRSLAKTLSLLSNAQQTRVFGYLPMASGSLGSNSGETGKVPNPNGNPSTETNGSENATDGAGNPVTSPAEGHNEAVGNTPPSASSPDNGREGGESQPVSQGDDDSNFLLDLVKKINETLDGTLGTASPIVAGSADPVTALTEQLANDLAGNNSPAAQNSFTREAVTRWLRDFEAAYRSGGLRSFLFGN